MNRIQWYYENIGKRDLLYKLNFVNVHQLPSIQNVFINVNTKATLIEKKKVLPLLTGLEIISGQKMKKTFAKKSIAAFKLRKGQILGAAGTLRKEKLYYFLEKLFCIVLPKNKDFLKIESSDNFISQKYKLSLCHEKEYTMKQDSHFVNKRLSDSLFNANKNQDKFFLSLCPQKILHTKVPINFSGQSFLLYPELENYYELFESVKGFDVTIIVKSLRISPSFQSLLNTNICEKLIEIESPLGFASKDSVRKKIELKCTENLLLSLFVPTN